MERATTSTRWCWSATRRTSTSSRNSLRAALRRRRDHRRRSSDTLLADATDPLRVGDVAAGDYPIDTVNADGDRALIVSHRRRVHLRRPAGGGVRRRRACCTSFGGGSELVDENVSGASATDEQSGSLAGTGAGRLDEVLDSFELSRLVRDLVQAVSDVVTAAGRQYFGETDVFLEGRPPRAHPGDQHGQPDRRREPRGARKGDTTVRISMKNGGGIRVLDRPSTLYWRSCRRRRSPTPGRKPARSRSSTSRIPCVSTTACPSTAQPQELLAVLEHAVSGLRAGLDARAVPAGRRHSVLLRCRPCRPASAWSPPRW